MKTRDELIKSGHFARQRDFNNQSIAGTLELEAKNELVNRRYGYASCLRDHLSNGCIALILGEGDEEARRSFEASVEYALKLIGAPPTYGGGMRVYEANVELSDQGARLTSLHERKPQPGDEKMSIKDYHTALIAVVCFGASAQHPAVASVAEEAYQSTTIASADYWALLRAWKALLLGKDAEARREAEVASAKGSGSGKSEAAAMLAILDKDQTRLERSLQEAVKQYVKATAKQQNDPLTSVFFPGLMVCRVALGRGMKAVDEPYLPVRLLANAL